MALTNFAALTTEQKTTWARDVWKAARENSFIMQFAGKGENSMIQRITELTKSEKGTRAVITLVADLEGDGIAGDHQLEDNEEEINAYDQVIQIDQLRNANRLKGRMADQKSVVNFRNSSKSVLGYWMSDRLDQLAFLTMSGVSYAQKTNGALRPVLGGGTQGMNLTELDFAADVTAPSANRHYRWDGTAKALVPGDTTAMVVADTPSYEMLVQMKAAARNNFIKPIKGKNGQEYFHVFMCPLGIAKLKLDPDYIANLRHAGPRTMDNGLFSGSVVTQDGLIIHDYRHVFNTFGATTGAAINAGDAGYKWGANADVNGQRVIFAGAQACGFADIGMPEWVEDQFDYGNQGGISAGKIMGFKKPVFKSQVTQTDEDFGLMVVDTAF